ncbi:MAG: ATP-dependent RecD-like DNA helicase [Polyangiaceae bacterium]
MPTTLTAEVERVTFENEETSFRVIRVGSVEGLSPAPAILAVVGTFQAVGPGTRIRATGELVDDPRHGRQFKADSLVPIEPNTLAGLEKYLGSGLIRGIGPALAKRIVGHFGLETLAILDKDPTRLGEVQGIGRQRAEDVRRAWSEQRVIANIMVLLQSHGASPALAARIYRRYGDRAAAVVQRNPYRLAMEVAGIGFRTADRLARGLGISGDHPERAQAGVLHELGQAADSGDTHCRRDELRARASELLGIDAAHVEAAIDALQAAERIEIDDDRVSLTWLATAEARVAQRMAELCAAPARRLGGLDAALRSFEATRQLSLAPEQERAVRAAAEHKVVVVTGGPGVGKTTIVQAIVAVMQRHSLSVRLAAPTGRAAKRLSEATSQPATTIHRLLEVDGKTGRFKRDADSPIEGDAVIIDETSMVDVPLADALLTAIPNEARVVLVGDVDQLPSVGPGAVLRDVIASGAVTTVRLTEIFRQAQESRIVINAHRILCGEPPQSAAAEDPGADFFVIQRRQPEDAQAVVRELVEERIPRRFGFDPKRDIQVLTPMHRGPVGTLALNALLQERLNPSQPGFESRGQRLSVGDKVMQTRNDYDREVYNGDLGQVVGVDRERKVMHVRFDGRDVEYDDTELDALTLAYASSIHKSQGSEYPVVVLPLLTSHFVMLSRNLLYTAVTRARRLCVLVADPRALRLCLAEDRREDRQTRLAQRIAAAGR